ncbi:ester cyclase [Streptomyces sp. S063]|uniref:ester cyclase n=1 Tax=Streptomyces sp. S063 TaxID=2005885 RepID=UPI001F3D774D|nr:ester cyclase [Streptomyces sp. S063]
MTWSAQECRSRAATWARTRGWKATGRDVSGTGHATFRCQGGKLAESWWNVDDLGMLQQIGAVDMP